MWGGAGWLGNKNLETGALAQTPTQHIPIVQWLWLGLRNAAAVDKSGGVDGTGVGGRSPP